MNKIKLLLIVSAFASISAFSQDKTMQVWKWGQVVYSEKTSEIDSIRFIDTQLPSSECNLTKVFFTNINSGITSDVEGAFPPTNTFVKFDVVNVTVPEECDLTNLKMSFELSEGAKLMIDGQTYTSPTPPLDFTNAVDAKIISQDDANTRTYTLLVKKGIKQLDDLVYSFMRSFSIPGISVSVMKGTDIIYSEGFGFADVDAKEKVTPDHLFRLASISKTFTSVLAMTLVDKGLLDIDSRVFGGGGLLNDEFPGVTGLKARVTVRNFLQHTSGWRSDPLDPCFDAPYSSKTVNEQIQYMLSCSQFTSPGVTHSYYNLGFSIVGKIIEKITGKTYEEYLEEVLAEAGITDIHIGKKDRIDKRPNECVFYGQSGYTGYSANMSVVAAAGGVIASTNQLMQYITHIDGKPEIPDIISASARTLMLTPSTATSAYGCGWRMNHSLFPQGYYHTGNLAGVATMYCMNLKGEYSAAILCNSRSYASLNGESFDNHLYYLLNNVFKVFVPIP